MPEKNQELEPKELELDESILIKEGNCQVCGRTAEFKVGEMHVCSSCRPIFMQEYEKLRKEVRYDHIIGVIGELKKLTKTLAHQLPESLQPTIQATRHATHDQEEWANQLAKQIIVDSIARTKQKLKK